MAENADIMVITPHPDDAEFGVAGTVAHWVREGKSVVYVVCTNGDKGTSDRSLKPEELARIRQKEQLAAAKLLGVKDVIFMGYPDQSLEDTPEFRKELVRLIRTYRPLIVVTADPYRRYLWHRDHRITGQAVLDAVFPYARDHLAYPDLLEQGLEPHKVREVWVWASDDPDHYVDIADTFDIKVAALGCHESQVGQKIHPDLRERVLRRAKDMAEGTAFNLVEAFHRVEPWG